jgi:hypothetical protein
MKHRFWALVAAAGMLTVSGCSHEPVYSGTGPLPVPASAAIGKAYPYHLSVRCGIEYAYFAGQWWQADKPRPAPSDADGYPYAYGSMTLLSRSRAKFTWPGVPAVVTFHSMAATEVSQPPSCK